MNALAFDTHSIARRYKAAGFTDEQVEAMVETARESASLPDLSHLSTKSDFAELRADFTSFKSEVKGEISNLRQSIADAKVQMVMATLGIVGFANGLLFFLLRK